MSSSDGERPEIGSDDCCGTIRFTKTCAHTSGVRIQPHTECHVSQRQCHGQHNVGRWSKARRTSDERICSEKEPYTSTGSIHARWYHSRPRSYRVSGDDQRTIIWFDMSTAAGPVSEATTGAARCTISTLPSVAEEIVCAAVAIRNTRCRHVRDDELMTVGCQS